MSFIIQGLDPILFGSLFEQKQANYEALPVERYEVTQSPGFPCRVTLDDAGIGEIVLLLSYQHHDASSPYAQAGPIFVTQGCAVAAKYIDEIPPALARRKLSLRAYDRDGSMVDAVIVDGATSQHEIERMFMDAKVTRIDAHNATRGCFAAHIHRHPTG
jgi:Protein of unknown function (DUF1203)